MKLTRLRFFYLIGYLVPAGAMLLFVPDLALNLLHSNGSYGDTMLRMPRGARSWRSAWWWCRSPACGSRRALHHDARRARPALGRARLALPRTSDPFFVVVAAVVVVGMALTSAGYVLDAKSAKPVTARA